MKVKIAYLAGILVLASLAIAQEKSSTMSGPPKVLVMSREFVKPGRTGSMHDKSEAAFVQAFAAAKWPTHYLAVDSLTGRPRSLFFTSYDSFDAWEKDAVATQKNATLSAALEKAGYSDSDLLSEIDGAAFRYREDLSFHPKGDIGNMRSFEISRYVVKPGHGKDWEQLVKLVMSGYEKIPDVHWACYELMYGNRAGTYAVFVSHKSAAELDQGLGRGKDFEAAMGEDGMKKLTELVSTAVEESEHNLFVVNPKMSYASEEWIAADPDFWNPKSAVATTHKKKAATEAAKQ